MANSVDPDQTALIGEVFSGSTLFASILNSSVKLGKQLQQTTFSDAFFGALRGNKMFKLMVNKIFTILCSNVLFILGL